MVRRSAPLQASFAFVLLLSTLACTAETVSITLTPTEATLATGATTQFTATVTGSDNTAVTWSVEEANGGTVADDGTYTAPSTTGAFTVVATAAADTSKTARATVTVAQAITLEIVPSTVTLNPGTSQTFAAPVSGSDNVAVTWSVQEGSAGGSVTQGGTYTAPAAVGAGTYHVVATSVADPTRSAIATVTLTTDPQVAVSIDPPAPTVTVSGLQSFTATVTNATNTAVTWSILEGAAGGAITSGGVYTAPASAGTFHVVATSVENTNKTAVATITVVTTPVVSVSLNTTSTTVLAGASYPFSATVSGSSNTAVTWAITEGATGGTVSAAGLYTAGSTDGTYHVVATSVADTTKTATATVTVALPALQTLSGVISYAGAKTGRIFLTVTQSSGGPGQNQAMIGTSVASPGAYTIRGLRGSSGTVTVTAFMDTLFNSSYTYISDPFASQNVSLTGNDINLNLTLVDPPAPATPVAPDAPNVVSNGDGALVLLNPLRDGMGQAMATEYKVYWSTTMNPGPSNNAPGSPRTVRAGQNDGLLLSASDVTAATAYYFAVAAVNDTLEGPASSDTGPFTIAAPTGGNTVSGNVSFTGVNTLGPVVVGLYSEGAGIYYTTVPTSPQTQAFTVVGVPNGEWNLFAFADIDNNGLIDLTDPKSGFSDQAGLSVSGAVTGLAATLTSANAVAAVTTEVFPVGGGSTEYQLSLRVEGNTKRPVKVTLLSGQRVNVPLDVPLDRDGQGRHGTWWRLATTAPTAGKVYTFETTYSNGTTENLIAAITGVWSGTPSSLTPGTGSVASATPTLSWTLPGSLPSSYSLRVSANVSSGGGGGSFNEWRVDLPPGTTSTPWNGASLSSGDSVNWTVELRDANGNRSSAHASFTKT